MIAVQFEPAAESPGSGLQLLSFEFQLDKVQQ